ncbi:MAG: hypothetical protein MSIBF_06010 [Candidatus Altiarchaeales archaeon IMC4]|nr:MAG: hypothetical protein MSIBF_06010 [Candidatus Altiarchaeales archaeon IMC4]
MSKREGFADEWFVKGDHDFETAQLLADKGGYADAICFHVHQALEKYLKGFLVHNNIGPKRIHDLEELIKACADVDEEFLKFIDTCSDITRYYFECRYPFAADDYSLDEAAKALDSAKEIIGFVKEKIKD